MLLSRRRGGRLLWPALGLVALFLYFSHRCFDVVNIAYSFHLTNVKPATEPAAVGRGGGDCAAGVSGSDALDKCQVLDIVFVCAGASTTRHASTLLKSILFHRRHRLRLHVLADRQAMRTLQLLLTTWRLPALEWHLYDAGRVLGLVDWIPNRHYSGVYGLLKLTLTDVLPASLQKAIVVDTDVVFVADIGALWAEFDRFEPGQLVGLVENQSPWYLGHLYRSQIVWPAIGRGFNTGVMLMDLAGLRSINWTRLWTDVARTHLRTLTATALADQDIINALLVSHPSLLRRLPCQWNIQLGDRSIMQLLCPTEPHQFKAVHWNSPSKTKVHSRLAELLRHHQQTFVDMDGALFRTQTIGCSNASTQAALPPDGDYDDYDEDGCYELRHAAAIGYRTHATYTTFNYTPASSYDVTLVTQLSFDRVQQLETLATAWLGPISLAVYLADADARRLLDLLEGPVLASRTNIGVHVVFREGPHYPINALRNAAMEQAVTGYLLLSDIDFVPSPGLYGQLQQHIRARGSLDRTALVVPAFESNSYRISSLARNKTELLNQLDTGQIHVFRMQEWPAGHGPTDYERWRAAEQPYSVGYRPEYEPYVVVGRDVPRYDRRFVGFGWNKVAHCMQLDALGYDFVVIPDGFLTHVPHAPSLEISRFRNEPQYRRCLKLLKQEFIKDLTKQRKRMRVVPIEATPVHL